MAEERDGQPEVEYVVGDVVSGTVTDVDDDGWLWLNVNGLEGGIAPDELALDDGESARERYAVGEAIDGLFVWDVDHEERYLGLSVKRNAPGYVEALQRRAVGEVVSGTITVVDDSLWLDVEGWEANIAQDELALADGESAYERYAVGEAIDGLFVWDVDHEGRYLGLSVKRNAPGYVEALQRRAVGEVVSGTVTAFGSNGDLWLDVNGLAGRVPHDELALDDEESARDRYDVGETIDGLVTWRVDLKARDLGLSFISFKFNTPDYLEALQRRAVGDIVSATVIGFQTNYGLWLDVDGLLGSIEPGELALANGESARDRYTVGETIEDLFVWQVDLKASRLDLSMKSDAPGYIGTLRRRAAGDVVSGIVTALADDGSLWLNVDGLVGIVASREIVRADGESALEHYTVDDVIDGLVVWRIDLEGRCLRLSAKRNTPGYIEALQRYVPGDVVSATVTHFLSDGGLGFDVAGLVGGISLRDLNLPDGESVRERYAVGETTHGLFVKRIDIAARTLQLSAKSGTSRGWVPALQWRTVGDVVSGRITDIDGGLWLDVGGLVGAVRPQELGLTDGESAQDRYTVGETVDGLFIWQLDHEARVLHLSIRRNMLSYVEALQQRTVGDVVSATVASFGSNGALWLNVDGLVGALGPQELDLVDGESMQDRYALGETIDGLFVWRVDHEDRSLDLSVKRGAPGYMEALQRYEVGDVVSGTIAGIDNHDTLWLGVDGLVGRLFSWDDLPLERAVSSYEALEARHSHRDPPLERTASYEALEVGRSLWDLPLADGESTQDRYTVGEAIDGLFVSDVDHEQRYLSLSVKRNAVGDVVSGTIIAVDDGLWLDVNGDVGDVPPDELTLGESESARERYAVGETIETLFWQVDTHAHENIFSVRRLTADFSKEPVVSDATIDAVVRKTAPPDVRMPIRVLAANESVWIPPHELSLSTSLQPQFKDRQVIRVVVVEIDDWGPMRLSHRQALDGWEAETRRLSCDTLVPNARRVPPEALSDAEIRADAVTVDLGPIIGFIPEAEMDRGAGQNVATYNETYRVVVESVDYERRTAVVSHDRFEERWRELAAGFQESEEIEGELRDFDGETALLDLGSGLLAQMPVRELPDSDPTGKAVLDRIGERFPLQITAVDRDKLTIHVKHQWIESLIGEPESETLEFKEVLKGDPDADDAKEMTRQAMRTINAFLNTEGGRLIIGVHDRTREVTGLEGDPGLDADTIEKKIDQATQMLEANLANLEPRDLLNDDLDGLVTWDTPSVRGGTLLVITCKRGPDAGVNYVVKGKPEFWVREGSSKKQLRTPREIRDHLRTRQQRAAAADDGATDD